MPNIPTIRLKPEQIKANLLSPKSCGKNIAGVIDQIQTGIIKFQRGSHRPSGG
jgi:hypothetical protein